MEAERRMDGMDSEATVAIEIEARPIHPASDYPITSGGRRMEIARCRLDFWEEPELEG